MQVENIERIEEEGRQELLLTMVATAEEVDAASKSFFKQIAKRDIPGFRKGKAPRSVLEQSVGGHDHAMGGVAETLINEMAFNAIDAADVLFIDEPQFNVDGMLEEGKPFSFTVKGVIAPTMKLASCGPVSIEMPPEEATEAEIADQIKDLQDYYHSFEKIEEEGHVAAMGDYVETELTVTNHDKPISGLSKASRMVGLGEGTMPASFDEHLVGAKVGDVLEFDFDARDAEGNSGFSGDGELHAVCTVKGFRRIVMPEVNDEFAAKVGCADVEDLHKQLTLAINMQKSKDLPKLMVDRAVFALTERLEGDVPEYYVDFIRQDVGRELMQQLEQQGTNLQQWMIENAINGDQMKQDVAEEAKRRASIDCALEAMFAELNLEVTEEDIAKMFDGEGQVEGSREEWEQAGRMANIRKMCRQSKVTAWLVDNADVTIVDEVALAAEAAAQA